MSEAKKLIAEMLAVAYPHAEVTVRSVRKGRGTSCSWLYIEVEGKIDEAVMRLIDKALLKAGLCGSYLPDDGFSTMNEPNTRWETPSLRGGGKIIR